MKVYLQGQRTHDYTLTVCPGGHDPANSRAEWFAGGKPLTFDVIFKYGCAEVPDDLGRYLLANGLAFRTSLITIGLAA